MTRDEKYELMIEILRAGPACGLSLHEIQDITGHRGHKFSLLDINDYLCGIRPLVKFEKVKRSRNKVTLYTLKETKKP